MALRQLPYAAAEPLVRKNLSLKEWPDTALLMRQLRPARARGYLLLSELEAVCIWKSPRAIHHIRSNSAGRIRRATRRAFSSDIERVRFDALTSLNGVSVPMASAILMLLDPKRYGVIDIRVWELLYKLGTVTNNKAGVGFSFGNWYQYLMVIRHFAKKLDCKARDVERTLFLVHKEYQDGLLYGASK
jgi:hypothetical protein